MQGEVKHLGFAYLRCAQGLLTLLIPLSGWLREPDHQYAWPPRLAELPQVIATCGALFFSDYRLIRMFGALNPPGVLLPIWVRH